jgi:hypothetical protein
MILTELKYFISRRRVKCKTATKDPSCDDVLALDASHKSEEQQHRNMYSCWNSVWQEESEFSHQCLLFARNPTWTVCASNPGLGGNKTAGCKCLNCSQSHWLILK